MLIGFSQGLTTEENKDLLSKQIQIKDTAKESDNVDQCARRQMRKSVEGEFASEQ